MLKEFNKFITSSIITAILFAIMGICLMIFPDISLNIMAYTVAVIFVLLGVFLITINYKYILLTDTVVAGILVILFGVLIFVYPQSFAMILPMILGIWFIMDSVLRIRLSLTLKDVKDSPWVLLLILSIISLICGIIFIINPLVTSEVLMMMFGALMTVYAISGMVDMIFFKKYINDIVKNFKKHLTIISE